MTRERFGVEKGLNIYLENSDTFVGWIVGTGAPDGLGDQASAPIGSIYQRINTGELYQKKTNVGDATDWIGFVSGSTVTRWRAELVDVLTNDVIAIGTRDVVTSPLSDDDGGLTGADFTIGRYVISDADGTPVLREITNVVGDNVTFAASPALVDGDAFIAKKYLPDVVNQENKALVVFSDGVMVKIADVDWEFATGIKLSSGFTKNNGTITSADTVESMGEKLSANQEDLTTLSGVAQGSVDLGTFPGSTIPDSQTIKQALSSLESAHEEVDQNVNDLITLSGVAENATHNGAMDQGDILSDNATTNALLKETDAELTRQRGKSNSAGVTTISAIDSVLVDNVANAQWLVTVEQQSAPANKKHFEVFAGHNGHAAADAVNVDDTQFAKLKQGANFNVSLTVDLNGAAGAQVMRLNAASTEPGGVNVYAKRIETLF